MKIIPYLRFVWVTFMIINFFLRTRFQFDKFDSIDVFFGLLDVLITTVFSAYCIITGLQEIKKKQIIDAPYFEFFGLCFQFLIFIGGFYLLTSLLNQPIDLWRLGLLTSWQFGLLVMMIVDFKRIRVT